MKFILKDGFIHIVDNHGIPNNNIEATIEVPDFKEPKVEFSINNEPFKILKNNVLKIEKNYLQSTSIKLEFRVNQDGNYVYFKADTIPLTHSLYFGGNIEDFYPEIIKNILVKIDRLQDVLLNSVDRTRVEVKQYMEDVESEVKQHMEDVESKVYKKSDFIKDTMKELVDTFEEITKKGSLF